MRNSHTNAKKSHSRTTYAPKIINEENILLSVYYQFLKHERMKEQAVNERWLAQPRCLWVNSKDNDPSDKCCSEDYLICFLSMS